MAVLVICARWSGIVVEDRSRNQPLRISVAWVISFRPSVATIWSRLAFSSTIACRSIWPTGPIRHFACRYDNEIVLKQIGDSVAADGEAYWPGKTVMPANEGEFAGSAKPSGNRLHFAGEALHTRYIGDVHGAHFSGIDAARRALESLATV